MDTSLEHIENVFYKCGQFSLEFEMRQRESMSLSETSMTNFESPKTLMHMMVERNRFSINRNDVRDGKTFGLLSNNSYLACSSKGSFNLRKNQWKTNIKRIEQDWTLDLTLNDRHYQDGPNKQV